MSCQIRLFLILTGLTGIDSITKISQVSVKTGGSVSIPCQYSPRYRHNVKYLCKGHDWRACSREIKSNQANSQKYSISDDKEQRIFTVTIEYLTEDDTEYYWCAVETKAEAYYIGYFHLSVTSGTPSLYVDHQFKASIGESATIRCSHNNSGQNKWCRLGGSCVTKSSGSIDGISVTINESVNFFTVTMSGLKPENSGWYLCVRGDVQMPVHLNVTGEHVTSSTINNNPETTTVLNVHLSTCQEWVTLPLRLNILVIVTPFICFLFKRYVIKKRQEPLTPAGDKEGVANTTV